MHSVPFQMQSSILVQIKSSKTAEECSLEQCQHQFLAHVLSKVSTKHCH